MDPNRTSSNRSATTFMTSIYSNIWYLVMGVAILVAVFYQKVYSVEVPIVKSDLDLSDNMIEVNSLNQKIPKPAIILIVVIILILLVVIIRNSKDFENQVKIQKTPTKYVAKRITKEEFDRQKNDTTKKEIEKLYNSPSFKRMLNQKGEDPKNWIWQTREKDKKVAFRDDVNSEDEANLSQITLSDS